MPVIQPAICVSPPVHRMRRAARILVLAAAVLLPGLASAQRAGGIYRAQLPDNPPSGSIWEETTTSTSRPFMGVFNNLVLFDIHAERNSLETIQPELATEWHWNEAQTELTFRLRPGVQWHDGRPFTARDVKCTWDMIRTGVSGTGDRMRKNPRRDLYANVREIRVQGEDTATFVLERPQPSLLMVLAGGQAPVYPCHVSARDMRNAPIGTGPFRFVEFRPGQFIRFERNANYWRPNRPYLDGMVWNIMPNRSTAALAFAAGDLEMLDVTTHALPELMRQAPQARCIPLGPVCQNNLLLSQNRRPFEDLRVRQAVTLALDRRAILQILGGEGAIGGAMIPPPAGEWGLPPEILSGLPGYGEDVEANRAAARDLMRAAGYSAENPLRIKIATRNYPNYRDMAVLVIDHLKHIYIEAELDTVDTSQWWAKLSRRDFDIGVNMNCVVTDDPDDALISNYSCRSPSNATGYCNPEVETLLGQQSAERDPIRRRSMVRQIDQLLQRDVARPITVYTSHVFCSPPTVRNYGFPRNTNSNTTRYEDVWLDR